MSVKQKSYTEKVNINKILQMFLRKCAAFISRNSNLQQTYIQKLFGW